MRTLISIEVNGVEHHDAVPDNLLLIDYLRDLKRLTGAKKGCDGGECGACTVLVDGMPRPACITLAASCDGCTVETIEGQLRDGRLSPVQRTFHEQLGTQCGYCTPGMVMATEALLRRTPEPTDADIRTALAGNLCRCTGYVKIIRAVRAAAEALQ